MMNKYDTIVVGLGAAGLTALAELAKNGQYVLGLEASDRIGGRVRTENFGDGVVEVGAEWIHGTEHSPVYDAATKHNIPLSTQDLYFGVYRSDGTPGDVELLNEIIAYCVGIVENQPRDPQPLGEYIIRKCRSYLSETRPEVLRDEDFMASFEIFMNLLTNNYESSNDWNDVSTGSRYTELEGEQHMSWHRHGYRTLFDIILNRFNNGPGFPNADIKLNTAVTRVTCPSRGGDAAEVTCADGARYEARHVVVTVSLGVLKARHKELFSPPLPAVKVDAIERMSIGVMDKIILSFSTQWWPLEHSFYGFLWRGEDRETMPDEDYWMTRIFGVSRPMGADNCLTLWTSGDVARMVESLPEEVVQRKATALLRRFMGTKCRVPEATGIIRSTWASNPHTLGSYTYDNLLATVYPNSRFDLAEPILDSSNRPRILFAGEATNQYHYSTVHGAMETGLREANRILGTKSRI